jgi:hypothetical protein
MRERSRDQRTGVHIDCVRMIEAVSARVGGRKSASVGFPRFLRRTSSGGRLTSSVRPHTHLCIRHRRGPGLPRLWSFRHLARGIIDHSCFEVASAAGVDSRARVYYLTVRLDLRSHVRQLEADRLKIADRPAELAAVEGEFRCVLQRTSIGDSFCRSQLRHPWFECRDKGGRRRAASF